MREGFKTGYEGTMFAGSAEARKVLDSVGTENEGFLNGEKATAAYVEYLKSGGDILGLEGEILHRSEDPVLTRVIMMDIVNALLGKKQHSKE